MNKTKRALKKVIYSRAMIFLFLLAVQIIIILGTYFFVSRYAVWVSNIIRLLSIVVIINIINNDDNAMYKLSWVIPILIFPAFGTLLYCYIKLRIVTDNIEKKYNLVLNDMIPFTKQDEKVIEEINDPFVLSMIKYCNNNNYSIYNNTKTTYFKMGENFFEAYKKDLKSAKKYIFIEYFIISDNSMWQEIFDILNVKKDEGVEIRIMYDGFGSLVTLPFDYNKYLNEIGIKCQVFSPLTPLLSDYQNNRDHRKITIIDGEIAYTGGLNLSDEYINKVVRHGHWKDNAIRIKGAAVDSMTLIFLQLWDVVSTKKTNYSLYLSHKHEKNEGFIMPYADSPLDKKNVGEEMYLDMINSSTKYVHIATPYLILDGETIRALKHAAERGVDTTICLPHIGDGKGTHEVATSYYLELIRSGVKIYEYLPGFVHQKVIVSDGVKAIVGTINFDYRSLYLHFENAVFMYKSKTINDVENDIQYIISKSELITEIKYKNISLFKRFIGRLLRIVAPQM